MVEPIPPITLPAARNPEQEGEWLKDRAAELAESGIHSRAS